jgi:hypothetical protein
LKLDPEAPGLDADTRARRRSLAKLQALPMDELLELARRSGAIIDMPAKCRACWLRGAHHCPGYRWPYSLFQQATAQCPDHKRYHGKRKPRVSCEGCWRIWIALNPRST